ncbi:MAG: hypothetical protein R3C51_04700 [Parvularculaceae bacterium]
MLKDSKSTNRRLIGYAFIALYVIFFGILMEFFGPGWPMFLFFLGGLPLALLLNKLGFASPKRSTFGGEPPSKKNRIIGFAFIYAYIAVFCFFFPHFDQRWQVYSFFLSGIPLAFVLWRLSW